MSTVEAVYAPRGARAAARASSRSWRPTVAAVLSFVLPGLGQLYNREPRLAALLVLPVVIMLLAVLLPPFLLAGSPLAALFDTGFLVRLLVVNAIILLIRLVAIVQAHLRRGSLSRRHVGTYLTALLVVVTVGMHALPGVYAAKAIETLNAVSLGGSGGGEDLQRLFLPAVTSGGEVDALQRPSPRASPGASPEPSAAPELPGAAAPPDDIEPPPANQPPPPPPPDIAAGERINILLAGLDRRCGREAYTTDTLIVLSLDPSTRSSVLLSLRRDFWGVPLSDGRVYEAKINSILSVAERYPYQFPLGPTETLKGAVSTLLGVPIHYFAAVDLGGFKYGVDAIGGIGVQVGAPLDDPYYRDINCQRVGFRLSAGWHHMDGETALAYVRSRRGPNNNDTARAMRHQTLLLALRNQLSGYDLVASLPSLLDVVSASVATDIPSGQMPVIAAAIDESNIGAVEQVVLQPPTYMTEGRWNDQFIYVPNIGAIRALARDLFD